MIEGSYAAYFMMTSLYYLPSFFQILFNVPNPPLPSHLAKPKKLTTIFVVLFL